MNKAIRAEFIQTERPGKEFASVHLAPCCECEFTGHGQIHKQRVELDFALFPSLQLSGLFFLPWRKHRRTSCSQASLRVPAGHHLRRLLLPGRGLLPGAERAGAGLPGAPVAVLDGGSGPTVSGKSAPGFFVFFMDPGKYGRCVCVCVCVCVSAREMLVEVGWFESVALQGMLFHATNNRGTSFLHCLASQEDQDRFVQAHGSDLSAFRVYSSHHWQAQGSTKLQFCPQVPSQITRVLCFWCPFLRG